MVIKQSCRNLNFEQLLFLEIFELPHKIGSNLGFKASSNSVNSVNSNRESHLTAGDLLLVSRRARGHLRLRAGEEKAAAWLLHSSWPHFKASDVAVLLRFLPLLFPSTLPLLR